MASATLAQSLQNIDNAILALSLNPRPNMTVGGRSYSMAELLFGLIENKRKLLMAYQDSDGPFEAISAGLTSSVSNTDGYFPPG